MKTDTTVHHVTQPGANIFLELGFAPVEAERLQAASQQQIDDARVEMPGRIGKPTKPNVG